MDDCHPTPSADRVIWASFCSFITAPALLGTIPLPLIAMSELKLSTRPPLTGYEATIVQDFEKALAASETFYVTGSVDVGVGAGDPMIFYTVDGVEAKWAFCIFLNPLTPLTTHAG